MPGVGLDVPALVDAAEHRPARGVELGRRREHEDAAPLRHEADRRGAGERGDARRTMRRRHRRRCALRDGHRRPRRARRRHARRARSPSPRRRRRCCRRRGGCCAGTPGAGGARRCRRRRARTPRRAVAFSRSTGTSARVAARVEQLAVRAGRAQDVPCGGERPVLSGFGDQQRAARRQDRPVGKAGRRRVEERAAREGQGAHLRRSVAFRRRALPSVRSSGSPAGSRARAGRCVRAVRGSGRSTRRRCRRRR